MVVELSVLPFVSEALRQNIEAWCSACHAFLLWERENIFAGEPTPEQRDKHRRTLEELLLGTRLLHILVSHSSVHDRSLANALDGRLGQLQESWEIANNPMSLNGAKALANEIFPEEKDLISRLSQ